MAESFFATPTLKAELVYRRAWPTRHELEMEVSGLRQGGVRRPGDQRALRVKAATA